MIVHPIPGDRVRVANLEKFREAHRELPLHGLLVSGVGVVQSYDPDPRDHKPVRITLPVWTDAGMHDCDFFVHERELDYAEADELTCTGLPPKEDG